MTETGWIGKPVKRREDARPLTGPGTCIDDHPPVANIFRGAIGHSPRARAKILGCDLSAALATDGVARTMTGADVAKHGKPSTRRR